MQRDPLGSKDGAADPRDAVGPEALSLVHARPAPLVRRMVILGNVSVGKTCLFDRLCGTEGHSVHIPGSTYRARLGVLAVGPGAAPRAFQRQCGSCAPRSAGRNVGLGCHNASDRCPGLEKRSARMASWRSWLMGSPRHPGVSGRDPGASLDEPAATHLYDTPGSATLAASGEDEMVGRDLLLSGQMDGAILVADAKNLRRSVALALEIAEFGLPMVLALNMVDEAETMGLEIDDAELTRALGIVVNRTVAVEEQGVGSLAELILDARVPRRPVQLPAALAGALSALEEILANPAVAPRGLGLLLLSSDRGAQTWVSEHLGEQTLEAARSRVEQAQSQFATPLKVLIADAYHAEARRIADRAVTSDVRRPTTLVHFGELAQRPLSGALIALGVLALAYLWVGAFGATYVVDAISLHVFQGFLIPVCEQLVAQIPSDFVRDALMDPDFGLLPTGLFLAVGIVLPVLFSFYLLQSVLEESGYLPRLAVLFDRLFRGIGLNGQGLISLVLGFSCITMAVITTRMLPTRKERLILTLLLVGIPCAPLLAVMMVLLGKLPWTAGAALFAVIGLRLLILGSLASRLIPGALPDLILEIPQMRIPRFRILLARTWQRTRHFMREAIPIFLMASFAVFLFDRVGGLTVIENLARPVVHGVLGLPDEAVQVFIKTAIRRESGATELNLLYDQFSNLQLIVILLVMTFVMPCINATIVIIKERGLVPATSILTTVLIFAIAAGAAMSFICRTAGITFT